MRRELQKPFVFSFLFLLPIFCASPSARALDAELADANFSKLVHTFNPADLAANEPNASLDFFKAAGEDGYRFLHASYSGHAESTVRMAALFVIFRDFPEHTKLYLEEPVHKSYGLDFNYSYEELKPFVARLEAYAKPKGQASPEATASAAASGIASGVVPAPGVATVGKEIADPNAAAIKTNAALGAAGLEPVKKLVSAAVAKDTADGKTKEAPALLALLELIDKNGSAAVLDAAAPFLTDERAPVAKAALKIFETHAGPYGAKLGSGQECLVWWTVEGKSLIK